MGIQICIILISLRDLKFIKSTKDIFVSRELLEQVPLNCSTVKLLTCQTF